MQRFTDKVVLVTGAGSGIGKASALRVAREGGSVFCVDLNREAVEATAAEITAAGGEEGNKEQRSKTRHEISYSGVPMRPAITAKF